MKIENSLSSFLSSLKGVGLLYSGAKCISNRFLMKKIEAFGTEPQSETSKKFLSSLSLQKFEELQDLLMHSLNSAESVIKSLYLRKLVNSLSEGKIDWNQFGKMNFILNQIYTFDLEKVAEFYHGSKSKLDKNEEERFFTLGLLDHESKHYSGNESATKRDLEVKYEKNDLGQLFVDCILFEEKKKIAARHKEEVEKNWDGYTKLMESMVKTTIGI